jgi:hypothetical protein
VFDAMLRNAVRICGAKYGMLSLCKGEEARSVAMYSVEPALVEKLQGKLRRPGPNTAAGRLMRTKTAVHIADVRTEPGFFDTPPGFAGPQLAIHAGARTLLAVPMRASWSAISSFIGRSRSRSPKSTLNWLRTSPH